MKTKELRKELIEFLEANNYFLSTLETKKNAIGVVDSYLDNYKKTRNENKTKAQRQNFKWLIIFGVVCFVFGEMKKSNENTNKNITYNELV